MSNRNHKSNLKLATNGTASPQRELSALRSPMRLEKVINNYSYNLDQQIGQGQFSSVFLGRHVKSGQIVAIKVIEVQRVNNDVFLTLLQNEIEILRMCQHQNLLKLHEVYNTVNNIYIITEYCNQGDLHQHIQKNKGLSSTESINIFKHLLLGLHEMQSRCVIHRDIKPANILISDSIPKFADFGFSVCKHVQTNSIGNYNVGTPLYMAPESLFSNTYSYKSDIWALGVVLFEMLYGQTPFYSPTEDKLKVKLKEYERHGQIPLPDQSVSQEILQIIAGMLTWDPSKRWSLQQILSQNIIFPKNLRQEMKSVPLTPSSSKNTTVRLKVTDCDVPEETSPQHPYFNPTIIQKQQSLSNNKYSFTGFSSNSPLTYKSTPQPHKFNKSFTKDTQLEGFQKFTLKVVSLLEQDSQNQATNIRIDNVKLQYCAMKLFAVKACQYRSVELKSALAQMSSLKQNPDFCRAVTLNENRFSKIVALEDTQESLVFYVNFENLLSSKLTNMVNLMNLKMSTSTAKSTLKTFKLQVQLIQHLINLAFIVKSNGQDFSVYSTMPTEKITVQEWEKLMASFNKLKN